MRSKGAVRQLKRASNVRLIESFLVSHGHVVAVGENEAGEHHAGFVLDVHHVISDGPHHLM